MSLTLRLVLVGLMGAACAAAMPDRATAQTPATIYMETFPNNTAVTNPPQGDHLDLSSVNWKANFTSGGTVFSGSADLTDSNTGPINSRFGGPDGNDGRLHHGNFERGEPWIYWTEEQTFGDISNLQSISFTTANADDNEDLQVALRVGTDWFTSIETFNDAAPGSSFDSTSDQLFELAGASFNTLDFVSGSSLNEGGATTLPAGGTVTAIGIFNDNLDSTVRLDDVAVVALIPEPASIAIWTLLGLALTGFGYYRASRNQ